MNDITFLDNFDDDIAAGAVLRAGGTDLQGRLRASGTTPQIADLTSVAGYAGITNNDDGTVSIGAGTTIATVARDLHDRYLALALTANGLATPQVRATATIGGNLTQHTRCWYYRHPDTTCFKSGGDTCPARSGRHLYGVAFDNSDCVHPHPSSIAMALLTYNATISTSTGSELTIEQLLGNGTDATRDHQLPDATIITAISLPEPWPDEAAAYYRAISRFEAEWPLVEAVARIRRDPDGTIGAAAIAIGGVATVPLPMRDAADQLVGGRLDDTTIEMAAQACTEGAQPLPETGYKVDLIAATVSHVLEQIRQQDKDSGAVLG